MPAGFTVTKGSVHRHLHTLVDRGYLTQNPATTRYAIGPKSRLLARLAPDADLVQLAEGPMRELRDALGHTVVMSAMTPHGALVLTTLASTSAIEIGVRPGSELTFHASAQGKILLDLRATPVPKPDPGTAPQDAFTDKTITYLSASKKHWWKSPNAATPRLLRKRLLGINAVAAPIFDNHDNCIASLAIVGSIQFLPAKPKPSDVVALKHATEQISRKLGHGRSQNGSYLDYRSRQRKSI